MPGFVELALFAFPAGVLGFAAAPCCGLLAPAYVPYVLGATESGALPLAPSSIGSSGEGVVLAPTRKVSRALALRRSLMFVLGFALVFTALGATASALGAALLDNMAILLRLAGWFVIVMGIASLGRARIPLFRSRRCIDTVRFRASPGAGLVLGVSFAIAWTPCTGPVLGATLAAAAATGTVWHGSALLFIYSLGLGLPFILLSLGLTRAQNTVAFLQRHRAAIERVGGLILIAVGVLIIVGGWQALLSPLTAWLVRRGWPPL